MSASRLPGACVLTALLGVACGSEPVSAPAVAASGTVEGVEADGSSVRMMFDQNGNGAGTDGLHCQRQPGASGGVLISTMGTSDGGLIRFSVQWEWRPPAVPGPGTRVESFSPESTVFVSLGLVEDGREFFYVQPSSPVGGDCESSFSRLDDERVEARLWCLQLPGDGAPSGRGLVLDVDCPLRLVD